MDILGRVTSTDIIQRDGKVFKVSTVEREITKSEAENNLQVLTNPVQPVALKNDVDMWQTASDYFSAKIAK